MFARDSGAAPIAFDIHFDDGGVVNEAVDSGQGHGLVGKDLVPFSESLIGGDHDGAMLVAPADQLEEHGGLGLILGDVGDIIEDEQMIAVEFGDGGFEGEVLPGDLQALDEVCGSGEQHAEAGFDEGAAET